MALTMQQKRKLKKWKPYLIIGGIILVVLLFFGGYWYFNRDLDLGGELVTTVEMKEVYDATDNVSRPDDIETANHTEDISDGKLTQEGIDALKGAATQNFDLALTEGFVLLSGSDSNPFLYEDIRLPEGSDFSKFFLNDEEALLFLSQLNVSSLSRKHNQGDVGSTYVNTSKKAIPGEPYAFLEPFHVTEQKFDAKDQTMLTRGAFSFQAGEAKRAFDTSYTVDVNGKIINFEFTETDLPEPPKEDTPPQ